MDKASSGKKPIMMLFVAMELLPLLSYRVIGLRADLFSVPTGDMIIPLGLSFFSLQAVTYTVGVYKGEVDVEKNPLIVLLFISFFPCISSGPIARAGKLLPQFRENKTFDYDAAADGFRLLGWGLLKKLVIADNLAMYIGAVRGAEGEKTGLALLLAALLYSFQLYLDFSGYSDIVIGCAKALGFELEKNFDHPYMSRSIGEFWRRWHISLSSWLKDYVYIPLGGSRVGALRRNLNTLVTFAVSGLWHGAGVTWIVWGLFHGVCLCVENITGLGKRADKSILRVLWTYILVTFGWIIFASNNLHEVFDTVIAFGKIPAEIASIAMGTVSAGGVLMIPHGFNLILALIFLITFLVISVMTYKKSGVEMIKARGPVIRWSCYLGLALLILFFSAENSGEFIYNRF
ncbi:MAG: MBOAT family protein [Butyrivibrio sp.]|nr:MBOAT family protein [Butyrivibrio sp.]